MTAMLRLPSFFSGVEPIMIFAFLQTSTGAPNVNSGEVQVFLGAIALIQILTAGGVLALFFRMGKYVGTNDQTIVGIQNSVSRVERSLDDHVASVNKVEEHIVATQTRHGETLVKLETKVDNMDRDVRLVRDRQHDFANILTKAMAHPVILRQEEERQET